MLPKILKYGAVLSCSILVLASLPASADEKKGDKAALSGTWGKKDGKLTIEFPDHGVMKIAPHGDSACVVVCRYRIEKAGLVKVKITGFEGQEEAKKKLQETVGVGLKFTFKWKVNGDTARLDDVVGDHVEMVKSHLEGDFEQKK
jgi:hypothetical protein